MHWLALDHIIHESFRVARPDHALVAIGRVQRQDEGVQAVMQRELLWQLQQHGMQAATAPGINAGSRKRLASEGRWCSTR